MTALSAQAASRKAWEEGGREGGREDSFGRKQRISIIGF